jgi:WD40 repeat protein
MQHCMTRYIPSDVGAFRLGEHPYGVETSVSPSTPCRDYFDTTISPTILCGPEASLSNEIAASLGLDNTRKLFKFNQKSYKISKRVVKPDKRLSVNYGQERMFKAVRIMDAPGLSDNFYASPVSYSGRRVLAIGLRDATYLWDRKDGARILLQNHQQPAFCISWSPTDDILAVARVDGSLCFWNIESGVHYDFNRSSTSIMFFLYMYGHPCAMAWRPGCSKSQLLIGTTSGYVCALSGQPSLSVISVSMQQKYHSDHICGMAFRADGTQFASGGNDNRVVLYKFEGDVFERRTEFLHHAAVKALAFCPWQQSLLATGR